jgi:hypothetical protein
MDAYARLEPGAAVVLISTRWHGDALAGRLIGKIRGGPAGLLQTARVPLRSCRGCGDRKLPAKLSRLHNQPATPEKAGGGSVPYLASALDPNGHTRGPNVRNDALAGRSQW